MTAIASAADETYGIDPRIFARRWKILVVLCTSLLIVIIGNTALNVALPTLGLELNASLSDMQWMVDSYALVFAGLLFSAGTLGDRFGRKGALQAGLLIFLAGSLVSSFADDSAQVILGRAIMGFAGAFIMPSTLSILTNIFPAHERARAIAIWAGISGAGAAVGPIASGWLIENFHWGSVFLVNVPVIAVALIAGGLLVPKSKDPGEHPIDVVGALLSIIGIGTLVYAIIEGPNHGWSSVETLLFFAVAVIAIALFVAWELYWRSPMLDLRLFRDRRFSVSSVGMALTFFAMFGTFFLVAQYFQLVHTYTAFASGLLTLPMAIVMMAIAPQIPKLVDHFGARRVVPVGLGLIALGLAAFSLVGVDSPAYTIYFSILPLAAGMAMTMTPLTTLIMASVPLERAGIGSAMNDTTRELGGALGVAILGSLVTSRYTSELAPAIANLPGQAKGIAVDGLAGALGVAGKMPGEAGDQLARAARESFVSGMSMAAMVGMAVVLIAAIGAWYLLPEPSEEGESEDVSKADLVVEGSYASASGEEPSDPDEDLSIEPSLV